MPTCHSCGYAASDFRSLALHIAGERKRHSRGKKWAAKFLLASSLHERPERNGAIGPRPDKSQCHMELSGEECSVPTICPRCQTKRMMNLPTEYTESERAWHKEKYFVVMCAECQ